MTSCLGTKSPGDKAPRASGLCHASRADTPVARNKLMWTDVLGWNVKEWPKSCVLASISLQYSSTRFPSADSPQPKNERQQRHPLDTVMQPVSPLPNDLHFYCFVCNVSKSVCISVITGWCYHSQTREAEAQQSDELAGLMAAPCPPHDLPSRPGAKGEKGSGWRDSEMEVE